MAAENILGKLIIEGANRVGGIAGGAPSLGSGLAGGGGGGQRSAEMETRSFQKTVKDAQVKAVGFAKEQPKWWTRMFKTLGIQMGLAGILKQSQVFTSTIGAMFQIFGAMVDVMLVPLVKPVLMPLMRWMARQIPTMGRLSKAFFGFVGSTIMGLIRVIKKIGGWVESGWNKFRKLFTTQWWADAFSTVVGAIAGLPGLMFTEIAKLFKWSTWENIFRSLWNSTLGGKSIGFGIKFPVWGGGSTWTTEGAGTKSETLVTKDEDTGKVLSYEAVGKSGLIESAFKTGLDKKGNVLQEKYGVDNKRTGNVLLGAFEWMNQPPADEVYGEEARTLAGYKKYRDAWKANRTGERTKDLDMKKITEFASNTIEGGREILGDIKGKFDELNLALKAALLLVGGQVAGMMLKDLTGTVARGLSLVTKGVSTPARAIKGIIYGIGKSFANPLKEDSFYRQLGKGGGMPGALGRTVSSWQLGFQPNKVGDVASDLGSGSRQLTGSARERALHRTLFPNARTAEDAVGKSQTSNLAKARKLLSELTSWLVNKLRNLKNLLRPNAFAQAERHLATKTSEIMGFLKGIPSGSGVTNIVSRLALLKSFLKRSIPLVGAAVGAVMTAKNIKTILGTDLSWFTANENTVAAQETNAQIRASLERVSGAVSEGSQLWQEGGAKNKVKAVGSWIAASIWGEGTSDQAMQGYMSHTKGGAILNQLLMGSVTTGTGLFGAAGIPAGISSAISQELAMADVRNNAQSIELYNQMLLAARAGATGIGHEINFKIEGMNAAMEMPGYLY